MNTDLGECVRVCACVCVAACVSEKEANGESEWGMDDAAAR